MSEQHIVIERRDAVIEIAMHRPEKRNALNRAMYRQMADALAVLDEDVGLRAALITGTADCFTSGNDIIDFLHNPQTAADSPVAQFLHRLSTARKPLLAAVNGPAIGIGTTLLLHCDLIYAGESARFQMPFVPLGLCPEAASSAIVPALLGQRRAAELLLLGEAIGAAQAREYGIVNAVAPDSEVLALARDKAARLAALPPDALRTTKALMKRVAAQTIEQAMAAEFEQFMRLLKGPEAMEAMTAFMQKRKPDFGNFT
jgi:enoyl-CoA hydratase/carnithine racemase